MFKTEKIKKEIEVLPVAMLDEIEVFIGKLKIRKKNTKKKSSLLSELANIAEEIDIPEDYSIQKDHYLYNLPKR